MISIEQNNTRNSRTRFTLVNRSKLDRDRMVHTLSLADKKFKISIIHYFIYKYLGLITIVFFMAPSMLDTISVLNYKNKKNSMD